MIQALAMPNQLQNVGLAKATTENTSENRDLGASSEWGIYHPIYCLLNWKIIINFWLWKNFSFGQIHFGFLFSVSVEANQNVQHGRVLRTMSTKESGKAHFCASIDADSIQNN